MPARCLAEQLWDGADGCELLSAASLAEPMPIRQVKLNPKTGKNLMGGKIQMLELAGKPG